MSTRVLVAAELRDLLDPDPLSGWAVEWLPASAPTPNGTYEAIVPLLSRPIGAVELDGLPALRVVANCAVGVDNVDLAAAASRRVLVTNTPGVLTDATADLTWALILAVTRRLKEGQALVQAGEWGGWHPTQLLGLALDGAVLGIVGAGRIGQAVGRRAIPFGMRVIYASRHRKPDFERETGAGRVQWDRLLGDADVVTVHLPATAETRGLFDRDRLGRMKPGAYFVNTARGELVDEPALVAALATGHLAGAGLDVFDREPAVPAELAAHPRVVTLPHLGSATARTRRAMATLAVRNVAAVLAGDAPLTPVVR